MSLYLHDKGYTYLDMNRLTIPEIRELVKADEEKNKEKEREKRKRW